MIESTYRIETIAAHAGGDVDPGSGAVTPPIHLSTTFARGEDGALLSPFLYARTDNPNRRALELCLSRLEGVSPNSCVAFSSGLAAVGAVLQALKPGDHVLAPLSAYYGTTKWLTDIIAPWGLRASFVDMSDLDAITRALQPETRLIWTETPSNPTLEVTDLSAVVDIAHQHGVLVGCDNTWATPLLQRPFDHGADIVVHSTTKYLGGHGDVTGGAVLVGRESENSALLAKIRLIQTQGGAVPSPFDCWLVIRGIRTLACRMRAHCDNAERIADFLCGRAEVDVVHYPGLTSDPGHVVAARQMKRFGGMVSVQIKGGAVAALRVLHNVRLFTRATSLGGPESLIEHRASVEGPNSTTPPGLLRLSIGLESADDLIEDLSQALGS